jgi:hypothetical protein
MNTKSKTGLQVLQVAIVIGLLADLLLRQTPWGLNVLLFNLAFVAGTATLLWRRKPEYLTGQTWALFAAQIFFASMFVWRDAEELLVADSVAIVAAMSVLIVPKLGIAPRIAGIFHYIIGFLWSSLNAAFGSVPLLTMDIDWKTGDRSTWAKNALAVLRGVLIVAPLILIFGALFMAADAAYEGLVNRVFNFDLSTALSHVFLTALFAWTTAGYLRSITLGKIPMSETGGNPSSSEGAPDTSSGSREKSEVDRTGGNAGRTESVVSTTSSFVAGLKEDEVESSSLPNNATVLEHINRSDPPNEPAKDSSSEQAETRAVARVSESATETPKPRWSWPNIDNSFLPPAFTLGSVEVGVIFGLIDLLFVSFVVMQIPYLFGGMDLVQNTPNFKLAEYARRGFGELVAVAALVLPLLLVAHWLIQRESARASALFKALAGIQLVLLFVIMASAVQRLVILTGPLGYGMTTVRLYPMIFMTWLAIVFVWFAVTVLRGARNYFAWGALWSAFFILGATNFLNPHDFIVRTNIHRMQQGRDFDANYNSQLSDDAVPALVKSISVMSVEDQCRVSYLINQRINRQPSSSDLRSWNLSRKSAEDSRAKLFVEFRPEQCPDYINWSWYGAGE